MCVCVRVPLTQQILCSILVVVCVVGEMVDLGTHTSLQACKITTRKRRRECVWVRWWWRVEVTRERNWDAEMVRRGERWTEWGREKNDGETNMGTITSYGKRLKKGEIGEKSRSVRRWRKGRMKRMMWEVNKITDVWHMSNAAPSTGRPHTEPDDVIP